MSAIEDALVSCQIENERLKARVKELEAIALYEHQPSPRVLQERIAELEAELLDEQMQSAENSKYANQQRATVETLEAERRGKALVDANDLSNVISQLHALWGKEGVEPEAIAALDRRLVAALKGAQGQ